MSDSPPVWAAFAETVRRVGPDLRACLIARVNDGHPDFPTRRAERLAFLRTFIDDPAIWHDQKRDQTDSRAAANPMHTVGNRAIREIGEMVGIPILYEEGLSEVDWDRYRAKVLMALVKE